MTKTITATPFKSLREKRQLAEAAVIHQRTLIAKAQIKIVTMKTHLIELKNKLSEAKQNEKEALKNNVKKAKTQK